MMQISQQSSHQLLDWMKPFEAIFVDLNAPRTIAMKMILDTLMMEIPV
jgi:hypothetical protein